jgi:selenocysteine-specific elongation factor
MRRIILGTAGHIDHGKTTLVRALTGVDTDRLPEEKRRGITIDLGFAAMSLDDVDIGIVDVPGHEALVRNMLAGATGIDLVMLVIAADEGIMPQTREHLAIMDLLEVRGAVVALTKSDLVEPEWLDLVTADVCDVLSSSRFADARVIHCSSTTGAGLDDLRSAIMDAARGIEERSRSDLFRLPVDRAFTVHGTGTVITGTVWSGEVQRDAQLILMPAETPARARGLQVHGHARQNAVAGERVALALAVDRDTVRRGDTLVIDDAWAPTMIITAHVRVLDDAAKPLAHRQRVRFHLGTAEILARVATLENPAIEPGASGWIQLRLEAPCIARAGDHFVVRSYSPVHTIAGGVIAEPAAQKRKRIDQPNADALAVLAGHHRDVRRRIQMDDGPAAMHAFTTLLRRAGSSGIDRDRLALDVPFDRAIARAVAQAALRDNNAVLIGQRLFDADLVDSARTALLDVVDQHHRASPLSPGVAPDELRHLTVRFGGDVIEYATQSLIRSKTLRNDEGHLARQDYRRATDPEQATIATAVADILERSGLEAPAIPEFPPPLRDRKDLLTILRYIEKQGTVVSVGRDRFIARTAIDPLLARLNAQFEAGQELTTADLKDAVGVSRKYLIPILEFLDREGISRRTGDNRIWLGASAKTG